MVTSRNEAVGSWGRAACGAPESAPSGPGESVTLGSAKDTLHRGIRTWRCSKSLAGLVETTFTG